LLSLPLLKIYISSSRPASSLPEGQKIKARPLFKGPGFFSEAAFLIFNIRRHPVRMFEFLFPAWYHQ